MSITPLIKKPGVMIISLDIPAGNVFFWKFCNSCHQNYEMELTEEQKNNFSGNMCKDMRVLTRDEKTINYEDYCRNSLCLDCEILFRKAQDPEIELIDISIPAPTTITEEYYWRTDEPPEPSEGKRWVICTDCMYWFESDKPTNDEDEKVTFLSADTCSDCVSFYET